MLDQGVVVTIESSMICKASDVSATECVCFKLACLVDRHLLLLGSCVSVSSVRLDIDKADFQSVQSQICQVDKIFQELSCICLHSRVAQEVTAVKKKILQEAEHNTTKKVAYDGITICLEHAPFNKNYETHFVQNHSHELCRLLTWEGPDVPIYVPVTQVASRKVIESI